MLLIVNRKDHLPHLSILVEALGNETDSQLRERAADYLSEVGGLEALVLLGNRLSTERDAKVQEALIESIETFGATFAREALKMLSVFSKGKKGAIGSEVELSVARVAGHILFRAQLSPTLSRSDWRALEWQGRWFLVPMLARATHARPKRLDLARVLVQSLAVLGGSHLDPLHAARWAPEMTEDVIRAVAESFNNTCTRVQHSNQFERSRTSWHDDDYDVGLADEEVVLTFSTVARELGSWSRSTERQIRAASLDACELMAHELSTCGLTIKEQCFQHFATVAIEEDDPSMKRKAISLIGALFYSWPIVEEIEGAPFGWETPDGRFPTPYTLGIAGNKSGDSFDTILDHAAAKSHLRIMRGGEEYPDDSDHAPFAAAKIPILYVCSGSHDDRHRPSDTSDKINVQGMTDVADLMESIIDELLDSPRPRFLSRP